MYDNILSIIDAIPVVEDWKTKVTRADKVTPNPFPGFDAEFVFRIEPRGAKLNKVIDQMAAESPRYKKIFGNLTTSRSALLKILTDRGEGDPTELANAKAAAIKAFYRAQLPLINKIKEDLKAAYPDKDFIFNPQAFLYSGRGDTEWEGYMYTVGTSPPPPEDISSPEDIMVGSGPEEAPPEPPAPTPAVDVPPPAAAASAPEEPDELVKVEKHILSRPEIDAIIDEIVVKLGLNPNTDLIVNNNASEALSEYQDMRIGSNLIEVPTVEVSDSYNSRNKSEEITDTGQGVELLRELPNVVAYIQTTKGRKVTSRDEWMKLMQGRQPTGVPNPLSPGHSRLSKKLSRYGAPIAKEIRRQQEKTRTYDEIAVYADINSATNRFTGQARKWGGEVRYTFFIIVPKESWVPKSKLKKKN